MNGGPIQVCPVCQYDLQTLPRNYRCPECGFEYDETMRIWIVTSSLTFSRVLVGLFVTGFVAAIVLLAFQAFGVIIILFALIWFLTIGRKIRRFIVIGKSGITYQFGTDGINFRNWRQVIGDVGYWMAHDSSGYDVLSMFQKNECREIREEISRRLGEFDLNSTAD